MTTESCTTPPCRSGAMPGDRKSTRLNSSHITMSYAVFCSKKKSDVRLDRLLGQLPAGLQVRACYARATHALSALDHVDAVSLHGPGLASPGHHNALRIVGC